AQRGAGGAKHRDPAGRGCPSGRHVEGQRDAQAGPVHVLLLGARPPRGGNGGDPDGEVSDGVRARAQLARGAAGAIVALGALVAAHVAGPVVPLAPLSLADRVVRLTPGGLATWAIERLQHAALWLL